MSEAPDIRAINKQVIEEFRTNDGEVLTGRFAGSKLILLTTTGAKSGAARTNPLMYVMDGARIIVFASKAGAPTNPHWYHNLLAHPDVTVEIGSERFSAKAAVKAGAERRRIWEESVRLHPFLTEIQARTARELPVIALEQKT